MYVRNHFVPSFHHLSLVSLLAAASLVLLLAVPTAAGVWNGVCKNDVARLCAGASGVDVANCMAENEADVSPECRQAIAERKERLRARGEELQSACAEELVQHCDEVDLGGGARVRCLGEHREALSPACRAVVESRSSDG